METVKCKVKPDKATCSACIETQQMFNVVDDCNKCEINNREYDLIAFGESFWDGTYTLVYHDGKLKKVSIDRITIL